MVMTNFYFRYHQKYDTNDNQIVIQQLESLKIFMLFKHIVLKFYGN